MPFSRKKWSHFIKKLGFVRLGEKLIYARQRERERKRGMERESEREREGERKRERGREKVKRVGVAKTRPFVRFTLRRPQLLYNTGHSCTYEFQH